MNHWKIGLLILVLLALPAAPTHAISLEIIGPGQGFQDVSGNGSMVLDGDKQAVLWTEEGGWRGLGGFPVDSCDGGIGVSSGWGISADGSVAVGLSPLLADGFCKARAVSGDGQIAVGWTETDFGTWRPTRWLADGTEQLLEPAPTEFSQAIGVNQDGSVVVGELEKHAFYWTENDGIVDLGLVPGVSGTLSHAVGVSADGTAIVGWGGSPPAALNGFLWTVADGMRNLNQIVADAGIDLGAKFISHATAISADGNTIVGAILDPNTWLYDAYRLLLGPPAIPTIPDGNNPLYGPPLRLEQLEGGSIRLTWSRTCAETEADYGIYQGTLGSFAQHVPVQCGTGGVTEAEISPASGDTYYLVVPFDGDYESSYGTDSDGTERPVGLLACAAEQTSGSCE